MTDLKNNNKVKIEGTLSEVNLKTSTYVDDHGVTVDAIGGVIKVRVNQLINGKDTELDIPVHMFAKKLTNKGTPNPAYTSIEKVMKEFSSIAAVGIDEADKVRITNGNITMNEYYSPNGTFSAYPRIQASFVSRITDGPFKPQATFDVIFKIDSMGYETDSDGVENPNRFKVRGVLPKFNGAVDVVDFYATSPGVIDAVSSYWTNGDTVSLNGKLNFTSRTEEVVKEVDFGEPIVERKTITVSELIITGGSNTPLEGEFALDDEMIERGLRARQAYLATQKEKAKSKSKTSGGTNSATSAKRPIDLGF